MRYHIHPLVFALLAALLFLGTSPNLPSVGAARRVLATSAPQPIAALTTGVAAQSGRQVYAPITAPITATTTLTAALPITVTATPLPPTATPPPTPVPPSAYGQQALAYIAGREKISVGRLKVENEFQRPAALLGRTFQAVNVVDSSTGRIFEVLVDSASQQATDPPTIVALEQQAQVARYGKLEPALAERLKGMSDNATATVMVWLASPKGRVAREAEILAALSAQFPEARDAI